MRMLVSEMGSRNLSCNGPRTLLNRLILLPTMWEKSSLTDFKLLMI